MVIYQMLEFDCVTVCVCVSGLIKRENGSMEKELGDLRRSRPKPPVGGDFTLSDCFYFTRKGFESIVEDEVFFFFINMNKFLYWMVIMDF